MKVTTGPNFKSILFTATVLQYSARALVGYYARPHTKQLTPNKSHVGLTVEVGKLLLSCVAEYFYTNKKFCQSFNVHILKQPYDAFKSFLPAFLCLLAEKLYFFALLRSAKFPCRLTMESKLLMMAIISVTLLNRTYNIQQWICLVLLCFGKTIASSNFGSEFAEMLVILGFAPKALFFGWTCAIIACGSVALGWVYFEKLLKIKGGEGVVIQPASLWMRSIQFSLFSIMLHAIYNWWMEGDNPFLKPNQSYYYGFTSWVWVSVCLQCLGGLLQVAVLKYTDNVVNGIAYSLSIILTELGLGLVGGRLGFLTINCPIGTIFILGSVYYFRNPLPISIQRMIDGNKRSVLEATSQVQVQE
jgi:UDP-galactose transporter